MIEILHSELSGQLAIRAAAEVIATDAVFNVRISDAHGRTGHGTSDQLIGPANAYEAIIERTRAAWSSFKEAIAASRELDQTAHGALERALEEARRALDAMTADARRS